MEQLFEFVETISDLVCTNDPEYYRVASSCACADVNISKHETPCLKDVEYENKLRKKFEHIEVLLGSKSEQALHVMHKFCSSIPTFEQQFCESARPSFNNHMYFCKKRNRNSLCNVGASLIDAKSLDGHKDLSSKDYFIDVPYTNADSKEYDPISPISQSSFFRCKHNFLDDFEDLNKPLQFLSYQENDSFALRSLFSEESDYQNILNYTANYDSYDYVILREIMNHSFSLTYHPCQKEESKNISSTSVKFWVEVNSCVDPKLVWKEERHGSGNRSIDLSSISRVLKAEYAHRQKPSFIKLKNSFTLQCSDTHEVYLFEAKSEEECDKLIYGLKCIIAKIASMRIVGDNDVYEAFSSLYGRMAN